MKFDLYLELATRELDSRLLHLLRFPLNEAQARGEWFARWWTRGRTKRIHAIDRERMLGKVGAERFNHLDMNWKLVGEPSLIGFVKIISASTAFYPSPFSELWAEVPIHRLKSPAENKARMNFRNIESVLTRPHEVPFPSILECFFSLETPKESLNANALQALSIEWVRAVLPPQLCTQEIFGYGCLHGSCRKMLMTMALGFPEIDELGSKFEAIYPILIGPRASCEGLSSGLGFGTVTPIPNDSPSAILSIPPARVQEASQNPESRRWIVKRPEIVDRLGPKVFVVPPPSKRSRKGE